MLNQRSGENIDSNFSADLHIFRLAVKSIMQSRVSVEYILRNKSLFDSILFYGIARVRACACVPSAA